MSKVGGSYPPIIQGVSQQEPQYRRQGQVGEQINMLSDPVYGLVRRQGTEYLDELSVIPEAGAVADARRLGEFSFTLEGVEYALLYRREASARNKDKLLHLFNKVTQEFIPIIYESSSWITSLVSGGISALAAAGRYLYLAGNTTIPTSTSTNLWQAATNAQRSAVWIKQGAFSRTFSITVTKSDNSTVTAVYETKPSAYPELLDTSGIDFYESDGVTPREDYQKDMNDAVNLYNSQVNAWVREAAEDILPGNIAQNLVDELFDAGITCYRFDGHVCIDDPNVVRVVASDDGDGSLITVAAQEVDSPDDVTLYHYVGKVVRVRPSGGGDSSAYYLEARSETGETGWARVSWYEAAGVVHTPTTMFAQLIVHNGTAYVAQNGAGLSLLAPTSGTHPEYKASVVGDGITSPVPNFVGKPITWLSVFQDRLLVGSGGVVNASRPGDYLNFYRQTVLSILDNDPIEAYAFGSEGDTLRYSVEYDKSLIIFGDKFQYGISGQSLFTPKAPLIVQVGAHEDGARCSPIASGNYVFYAKRSEGHTALQRMQYGQLLQSPSAYEVSQQLDDYLGNEPAHIVALTTPDFVVVKPRDQDRWFVYRYIDTAQGLALDSWSRWEYDSALGAVAGISTYKGQLIVFTMRTNGSNCYIVADSASMSGRPTKAPALDSWVPYGSAPLWHSTGVELSAAFGPASQYALVGGAVDDAEDLAESVGGNLGDMRVGCPARALVSPTNPFVRDGNGLPVLTGILTVTGITVSLSETAALRVTVSNKMREQEVLNFEGRVTGNVENIIDGQPTYTGLVGFSVGQDNRNCTITLHAQTWMPLTITGLDWTGQVFTRVRRF